MVDACSGNGKLCDFSLDQGTIQYVWLVTLLFPSHFSTSSSYCSHLAVLDGKQLVLFVLRQAYSLNDYCRLSCLVCCHGYIPIQKVWKVAYRQENSESPKILLFAFMLRYAGTAKSSQYCLLIFIFQPSSIQLMAQSLLGNCGSNIHRSPVSKITNQSHLLDVGWLFPTS